MTVTDYEIELPDTDYDIDLPDTDYDFDLPDAVDYEEVPVKEKGVFDYIKDFGSELAESFGIGVGEGASGLLLNQYPTDEELKTYYKKKRGVLDDLSRLAGRIYSDAPAALAFTGAVGLATGNPLAAGFAGFAGPAVLDDLLVQWTLLRRFDPSLSVGDTLQIIANNPDTYLNAAKSSTEALLFNNAGKIFNILRKAPGGQKILNHKAVEGVGEQLVKTASIGGIEALSSDTPAEDFLHAFSMLSGIEALLHLPGHVASKSATRLKNLYVKHGLNPRQIMEAIGKEKLEEVLDEPSKFDQVLEQIEKNAEQEAEAIRQQANEKVEEEIQEQIKNFNEKRLYLEESIDKQTEKAKAKAEKESQELSEQIEKETQKLQEKTDREVNKLKKEADDKELAKLEKEEAKAKEKIEEAEEKARLIIEDYEKYESEVLVELDKELERIKKEEEQELQRLQKEHEEAVEKVLDEQKTAQLAELENVEQNAALRKKITEIKENIRKLQKRGKERRTEAEQKAIDDLKRELLITEERYKEVLRQAKENAKKSIERIEQRRESQRQKLKQKQERVKRQKELERQGIEKTTLRELEKDRASILETANRMRRTAEIEATASVKYAQKRFANNIERNAKEVDKLLENQKTKEAKIYEDALKKMDAIYKEAAKKEEALRHEYNRRKRNITDETAERIDRKRQELLESAEKKANTVLESARRRIDQARQNNVIHFKFGEVVPGLSEELGEKRGKAVYEPISEKDKGKSSKQIIRENTVSRRPGTIQTVRDLWLKVLEKIREFSKVRKNIFDKYSPIKKLEERAGVDPESSGYFLLDQMRSEDPAVRMLEERGLRDYETQILTSESLNGFLGDVDSYVKKHGLTREDFSDYLIARQVLLRQDKGIRMGIPTDAAKEVVKNGEKHFEGFAKRLDALNDAALDYYAKSGFKGKAELERIKAALDLYVPMYRFQEANDKIPSGSGSKILRRMKGLGKRLLGKLEKDEIGTGDPTKEAVGRIIDPLYASIKNQQALIRAADRNRAMNLIRNSLEKTGEGRLVKSEVGKGKKYTKEELLEVLGDDFDVEAIDKIDGLRDFIDDIANSVSDETYVPGPNQISGYREGVRWVMEVNDPDIAAGLKHVQPVPLPMLFRAIEAATTFSAGVITAHPLTAFLILFKDQLERSIKSKYSNIPFKAMISGLSDMIGTREYADKFWGSSYGRAFQKNLAKNLTTEFESSKIGRVFNKLGTSWINPVALIHEGIGYLDRAQNVGEFKAAYKALGHLPEAERVRKATQAARESGVARNRLGSWFDNPYVSAYIGSIMFARNTIANLGQVVPAVGKVIRYPLSPPAIAAWTTLTFPTILNYYMNRGDTRYDAIPDDVKFHANVWFTDDSETNEPIIDRDPWEVGMVFRALPRYFLAYLDSQDPKLVPRLGKHIYEELAINPESAIARVLTGQAASTRYRDHKPVIPKKLENVEPWLQYYSDSSPAMVELAKLGGYSPIAVGNVIKEVIGARWVKDLTYLADKSLELSGYNTKPVKKTNADMFMIGALFYKYRHQSQQYRDLLEAIDVHEGRKANYKRMIELRMYDEAEKYKDENPWMETQKIQKTLSVYEKVRNDARLNPDLTEKERSETIEDATIQIRDISKEYLPIVENALKPQ